MAGKQSERRQVLIPDEIWSEVQACADEDTTSASQIVRKACKLYTDQRKANRDKKAAAK